MIYNKTNAYSITLLSIIVCLSGCVSVKQPNLNNASIIQSTKSLEGSYRLYKKFSAEGNVSPQDVEDTIGFYKTICKINSINKTKIYVEIYRDDTCISKEIIKGKIKDGIFVSRIKFKIVPLIIYNTWASEQSVYLLTSDRGLRIENVYSDGGWAFLILAGGHYWHSIYEYSPVGQ